MKKILIFSAGRSDFERYYPYINSLKNNKKIKLRIYASKANLIDKFGNYRKYIQKKGFLVVNNLNFNKLETPL
jgi:hypothetical protein